MKTLIKTYKESGGFTKDQKVKFFIKPSNKILDIIIKSNDINFRKICLTAILDFNQNDIILKNYKDFIKIPIIKQTLENMYKNDL